MIRTIQSVDSYYEYKRWLEFLEQQQLPFSEVFEDEARIIVCETIAIVFTYRRKRNALGKR